MHKYFFVFVVCIFIFSCKKEKQDVVYNDLSVSSSIELTKILQIDSICFIIGGERYAQSKIYKLNCNTSVLEECVLPTIAEKKELYGIAKNSLNDILIVGYGGTQYISHDTGKTWQYKQHNSWEELRSVAFNKNDSAIIVGKKTEKLGYVFSVDKNGSGNSKPYKDYNFDVTDVEFTNVSTGYLCGYGAVLKSVDTGKTFSFLDAQNDYFKAMKWKDENTGIVVGYEGSILKTANAGDKWTTIRNANNLFQKKLHFLGIANKNNSWLIVGEKGTILYSTNNGDSWTELKTFTTNDLRSGLLISESKAVVVGNNGSLFLVDL